MKNLESLRREYMSRVLRVENLHINPVTQFEIWLNEALNAGLPDANAMALSTATAAGKPSVRIVLLKHVSSKGFSFFTNYESKKAIQIKENPYGALLFYWNTFERQVRIEGPIEKTSEKESDEYFSARPEGSRIGAWASPQSRQIPNREYLDALQENYIRLFKKSEVKRPLFWGGYLLKPNLFEFWQGRENRLHDRFEYTLRSGGWEIHRLAP
ncbi:MAG: pyridoxamine 5'-phosphate oxidase [Bacteroidales bacterium]|nr:pyridoxamine 5'-phosphate oxidase [Bacteroidales bacterium]